MELLFILIVFVVPVILFKFFPPAYKQRFFIFSIVLLIFGYYFYKQDYTFFRLGFRIDNLWISISVNLVFAFAGTLVLLILKKLNRKENKNSIPKFHFLFGFVVVSFIQELVYRSFLLIKLSEIFNSVPVAILINSLLFGLLHIMYPNSIRNFLLTFAAGIFFCLIYYFYPNIYGITLSHSILNFVALKYGIIGP